MESPIFTIDIHKDLDHKGRENLAKNTSNQEILIILSEDSWEYVKGQVVQNINTPIYILIKMLKEYDGVPWLKRTESLYSKYTKESIEKTLKFQQTIKILRGKIKGMLLGYFGVETKELIGQ